MSRVVLGTIASAVLGAALALSHEIADPVLVVLMFGGIGALVGVGANVRVHQLPSSLKLGLIALVLCGGLLTGLVGGIVWGLTFIAIGQMVAIVLARSFHGATQRPP